MEAGNWVSVWGQWVIVYHTEPPFLPPLCQAADESSLRQQYLDLNGTLESLKTKSASLEGDVAARWAVGGGWGERGTREENVDGIVGSPCTVIKSYK